MTLNLLAGIVVGAVVSFTAIRVVRYIDRLKATIEHLERNQWNGKT